jgi:DNA-binding IclR family transcriptional regulator
MTVSPHGRQTSAQKALALLEALAGEQRPLGVSDLGRLVGASRGTVHKHLCGLVEAGWVEQDHQGRYGLTLTPAMVGNAALGQAGLGARIHAAMEEIVAETGETVSIAAVYRSGTRIVQRAESDHILHADIRVGTEFPLDTGASSHVLCAFALTERARTALREAGAAVLAEEEVERVRAEGVARTVDELQPGISAVSVPLRDRLRFKVFALTLSAPNERMDFAAHEAALRRGRMRLEGVTG